MATKYFIRAGFVESNQPALPSGKVGGPNPPLSNGKFDLRRWLKNELAFLRAPAVDPCCTADPTSQPTRFNTTSGHLEYLSASTGLWTTVPNL